MNVGNLLKFFAAAQKLQKKEWPVESDEADNTMNGVNLLWDAEDKGIYLVAHTGHTLYWELMQDCSNKSGHDGVACDIAELFEKDAKAVGEGRKLLPCLIYHKDLAWLSTQLKGFNKANTIRLYNVVRLPDDPDTVELWFVITGSYSGGGEWKCKATLKAFSDGLENRLWGELVQHRNDFDKRHMPDTAYRNCYVNAPELAQVLQFMVPRDPKEQEQAVEMVRYVSLFKGKDEKTGKRTVEFMQHHFDIRTMVWGEKYGAITMMMKRENYNNRQTAEQEEEEE